MMILTYFAQASGIIISDSYVFILNELFSKEKRTTFSFTNLARKASFILAMPIVFVIANLFSPVVSFGQGTSVGSAQVASGTMPGEKLDLEQRIRETLKTNGEAIRFMENKGQIPNSNVRYYFESPAGAVYVEKDRIRFVALQDTLVPEHEDYEEEEHGEEESHEEEEMMKAIKATHTFSLYLNGMNPNPSIRLGDQFKTNYNYFLSEDPSGWASGVKASKEITLEDVYPGIDLRLYSNSDGSMEFDWVMDAGADFSKVQMQFAGQDSLDVEVDGSLKVGLRFTDVRFHIPESYQVTEMGKIPVEFAFNKLNDNTVHFTTSALIDPRFPLVIDPILNWGTFMDGNDTNFDAYLFAIQVDTDGSVYCTGGANRNIPTGVAPYDANGYDNTVANLNGGTGVTSFPNVTVVYKISSNGADLMELTLFGNDAVDANNNEKTVAQALSLSTNRVYIGGTTNVNIPTAGTQFDGSLDGTDGFVAVFSKDLGTLQYSSYLGAGGTEALGVTSVRAISDTQFAVGMTANGALPASYISATNTDNTYSGSEMYIAKFSISSGTNFNTLTYGTYVGGTDNEEFNDLEVLANGRIAFVGSTSGTNLTEVNGAGAAGTGIDGVIGVINTAGSGYNYLDRIGGTGTDRLNDVEILGETLYWTGSASTGFPTSGGAYDVSYNGGTSDVIVGSVSAAGSTGYAATFYGTASVDIGSGIRVVSVSDCNNNLNTFLLVFGTVGGIGMPTLNINNEAFYYASYTPGGNSQYDMFFAGFNGAMTSLSYGTYMGGNADDYLGDTGAPRGANHLWVSGSSVFLGTTTHSATHNPNLLDGFDESKSNGNNDSHIILGIQFNSITETDYSDASNTYGVPSHIVDCADLHIGTTIDAEAAALPTALADGDDLSGSDDEDAVTTLPTLTPGGPQNVSVTVVNITNTIGSTANIYGWIDFDGDGAFEASEFASNTVATGQVNVSRVLTWTGITVSGGANSHFMRIRITTNTLADAGGTPNVDERSTLTATNGEVEDYLLSLNCPSSCTISGGPGGSVCPNSQATFGVTISGCQTPTYSWSLINNTSNATIVGTNTASTVTVSAGTNCGAYTIRSSITCAGCADPIVCTQTVNVVDATPPVITCATQTTPINCPATPTWVAPTATDACDATVVITFTTTTTQGTCAGTSSHTRTWTATDDCGNTATCSRTIVVQDITPPTITCATQTTPINCPAVPTWIPPTATDACDPTVAITFADATTQGSCAGTYSVTRTWTATDDCGNTASCSRTIVVRDIAPPTITCATQTSPIDCPATPVWITPTATDACDATVAITFTDATTQGSCAGTYSVTRTWTATDDCGNTASCNRTIIVRDIIPPTITCATQTSPINCPSAPVFVAPTATDACDATVTITFIDATTQGTCAGTYSVTRTWTATDDCGNTGTCSGTIVVRDITPPTITCATQTSPIDCPATPVWVSPTATDACDATVVITFADATTQGSCAGTYSVTRTWTATDDCGNTATCTRTIVVLDITPPTITCANQTTPIECPATPAWVAPTATDACDATVAITFTDATTQGSCAGTYSVTRTWTATDDCGNTATCSRTIVVRDITPPTITCATQSSPIDCPATPIWIAPTATDACDATVTITFVDATTQGSCAGTYSVTRTWTATDDCGNTASCNRTIVVRDITPPTITCATQTTPINCPLVPIFIAPTATDACDATVALTFIDATTQGSCAGTYSVTRTWTATDDCGNTASCSRTIVVRDITPPTCATQDITVSVNPVSGTATITPSQVNNGSSDLCSAVTLSVIPSTFSCNDAGPNVVTLTVTDVCGNSSSCTATVTIVGCADLSLSKTVNNGSPNVGDVVTFTITVNNAGPNAATNVGVGDVIPNGYAYVAGSIAGGTTQNASGVPTLAWTIASIANGGSAVLTFQATVLAPGAGVLYLNHAEVTVSNQYDPDSQPDPTPDADPPTQDDEDTEPVTPQVADLSLIKTVNNGTPNVGEVVTFTITVSNAGPNTATNVAVGDVIPNGYAYVAGSIAGGSTQNAGGVPILAWTIASIPNGGSAVLTFQATVLAPGGEVSYLNHAEVTASTQYDPDSQPDPSPDSDPPTQDDEDTEPVTPQGADLSLIKTVNNASPNVGDVVTFTITVSNAGPNAATGVAVDDVIPNGYSYVAGSIAGGTTQNAGGAPTLIWTIASIANGGSSVLTFQATVLAPIAGRTYANVARVTVSNQFDPDSAPNNAADSSPGNGIGSADADGTQDPADEDDGDDAVTTPQVADLSLNKTVSNGTPNVGDVVTFTITVSNAGPNTATNVAVGDVIPNGYAYVAGSIAGGTTQNASGVPTLAWTISSIANGGSAVLTFQATVLAPGAGVLYLNHAEVTTSTQYDPDSQPDPTPDADPPTQDDEDTEPVTPQVADLSLIKSINNASPNVGDVVTFTITVSNAGPNAATGVAVDDVIPNGYAYVAGSIAGGTTQNAGGAPTLLWTIASIANGGSSVLTFQATVLAPIAGRTYANVARLTASNQYDPDSSPNNAADSSPGNGIGSADPDGTQDPADEDDGDDAVTTPQVADLSLNKTVNNGSPNVGDVVTFTITVSNAGPNAATNVGVGDLIPNGYAYVAGSIAGGTTQNASGVPTLAWTIASIANGGSAVLTFQATVLTPGGGVSYLNHAEVTVSNQYDPDSQPDPTPDADPPTQDDEDTEPVTPQVADLSLIKTVNNGTPNVGEVVTFTITVSNAGPNTATNVAVGDVIPNGYAYVAGSIAGGTTQNAGGAPTLAWTIASIPNGGSAVLTFQATVLAPGGVSYLNHAEVTACNQYDPDSQPDPTPDGDTPTQDDEDSEPVTPIQADLSLVKTVNNATPNVGDVVTFTITVSNAGPNTATNVAVGDVIPNGYTYVAGSIAGGTTQNASGVPTLAWTIASIANGGSAVLTFQATVLAPGGGVSYLNHAEVTASNQYDPDSQPDATPDADAPTQDDEDTEPVSPGQADLSLVKTVSNSTPNVGDVVTFTITVSNAGPNTATNVAVGDVIPNGYTYVAGSIAGGTTQNASGVPTLAWTIASIINGGSAVLTFQAIVLAPGAGISYLNHAEVTASNQYDPDSQPDATPDEDAPTQDDEDTEPVIPQMADLSLIKTVNNATPNVGDVVTFTITVSNAGPNTATNVAVGDVIPNGYTYVAGSIAGGTTQNASGVPMLAWTIASIANGGSAVLTFQATVLAPGAGVLYLNHAEVTASNQYDPDSQPDPTADADPPTQDDEETEPVIPQVADISLIKSVNNATPNVGDVVTFTITVSNAGPNAATGVSVNDVIPNGYTYVAGSIAGGTTQNAGGAPSLIWTIASIANGGSSVLTFQATVLAPIAGRTYANVARVTASNQYDPDSSPNNAADSSPGNGIGSADADGTQDPADEDDGDDAVTTPQVADLSLIKTVNNATPNVGDVVTFTITVSNAGPNTATNVAVGDVIPNGYSYVAGSIAGGTTQNASGAPTLAWTIASIVNGGSAVLTFQATVLAPGAGVVYLNHAEVTASTQYDPDSQPDPTPDADPPTQDDEDTEPVTPQVADLSLIKTVSNAMPNVGDVVTFTLTVSNAGPNTATNVTVGDVIPNGYAYVGGSIAGGTTQNAGGVPILMWTIASIANGGNAILTFQATVLPLGPGVSYVNHAEVTHSDQFDPDSQPDPTPDSDAPVQDDEDDVTVLINCGTCNVINGPADPVCPGSVSVFTAQITGACNNPVYTWTVTGNVAGSTPNGSTITVTAGSVCGQPYTVSVSILCQDCGSSPIVCSDVVMVNDVVPPTIICVNQTTPINCPAVPVFIPPTATDACDTNVDVSFTDEFVQGTCSGTYSVTRTWVAGDNCGNTASCSRTIVVRDNTPPTIICVAQATPINCPGVPVFVAPTATDACDTNVAISFSDATTQGSCAGTYSVTRTWTATDDCGNTSSCSRTIVVRDITPPSITCVAQTTPINCPAVPVFTAPTATDACDATVAITFTDATTEGSCAGTYSVSRTWTATDDCGNTATCSRTIVVWDITPPVCATQDITVSVDQASGIVTITASQVNNGSMDACSPVVLSVNPATFTCDNIGPNIVTLTVTDLCGNSSTCTATVTVNSCYEPCVNVNAWVYLEGSVTDPSGLPVYTIPMRTSLNNLHVLPGQTLLDPFFGPKYTPPGQPYDIAPWNYFGNEGDGYDSGGNPVPGNAGYPATVVDWLLVSLRTDSAGTGGPLCQAAALLHKNGYIEFVEPFDCCDLDLSETYYVVIEHRNHLIIMSQTAVPIVPGIDSSTITYDFRTQQSYVDDPFMIGIFARQKELLPQLPGVFAMYAGNGNQINTAFSDTDINFDDRTYWEGENGQIGEYKIGDYNLNGDTNFNDRVTWERNNGKFTSVPRN